jgi:hypothetical protein
MDTPSRQNRSWLAPTVACLFLAGILAPSVSGGPLGPLPPPPPAAAPAPAPNLLTLSSDGSVLAWQKTGSNKTTIHVQGVVPGASGFNLADPRGRLVGADQSSASAGFVEFWDQDLLRGTYTLLGPSPTSQSAVLARPDLTSFATHGNAFAWPMNQTTSDNLTASVGKMCQPAPEEWTSIGQLGLSIRGYDASSPTCALRLGSDAGCLMDLNTPCAWATAWAWAIKICPAGNTTRQCLSWLQQPSSTCGIQVPPCVSCPCPWEIVLQILMQTVSDTLSFVNCLEQTPLQCVHLPPSVCDGACESILNLVLGILGGGGGEHCGAGRIFYAGKYGSWCATPEEILQDSIPDDPVPLVFEPDENQNADSKTQELLKTGLNVPRLAPFLTDPDQNPGGGQGCLLSTCTVVFVHGYARGGAATASYEDWTPIRDYYLTHGYDEFQMVDYYGGACDSTSSATSHGSHDTWFSTPHFSGSGCAAGSSIVHETHSYMEHLAYHLAWWFYDTYGTKKIDVVAHSMGGLLVRYALTMVAMKDPNFPPALNIEDVVTLGTPHKGSSWACWGDTTQEIELCPSSGLMKWLKANAQDPQGATGTDWTLIGADDDDAVSPSSATGMTANHKVEYPNDTGGTANTAYEHSDYYQDDSGAADGDADFQDNDGAWFSWNTAPHSVRWAYYASTDPGW